MKKDLDALHAPRKKTNADKLRAMSDEELAEFVYNCDCPPAPMNCQHSCIQCWLDWLRQEAET